jgi:Flp pilus assembly protein TadD
VESVPVGVSAANWLALTREMQGRRPEARDILKTALAKAPDHLMTLANLGSMLVRDDMSAEGLPYLERAYARQPKSFEVIVNLVIAQGKLGNLDQARRYYREGGGDAARRPELINAMAYACYLNGGKREAGNFLTLSLQIDPNQAEARRLKEEIDRSGGS